MRQLQERLVTAFGGALLSITPAMATPVISTITTTYSSAGVPTSIFIIGSGLCGSPCAKPTITISGKALVVGNWGVTSVAATLPSGTTDGEYLLVFTAGTAGSFTQPLVLKSTTTVKVGTTTTLAPGSAATVTNTGTATAPVLAFGIPQGVPGIGLYEDSSQNTAGGIDTLVQRTGVANTAFGYDALAFNTGVLNSTYGSYNTAVGNGALVLNSTGAYNSAFGALTLGSNTTGLNNSAFGISALHYNTTGDENVALGESALTGNTTGSSNTAAGLGSLGQNTTGSLNSALGYGALSGNSTGSANVAVGANAGKNLNGGSNNIEISNFGTATDSGLIRIGTAGTHNSTYIAGITGVGVSGAAVIVSATGQLGVVSSSRRYKEDIQPMADASDRLFKLRPVTFRYKQPDANGGRSLQFGLIAEEVAEVFPELVIRNKDGQPESVAYHLLAGLLLNELQKEHSRVESQDKRISELEAGAASQRHESVELEQLRAEVTELRKLTAQLLSRSNNQLNAAATSNKANLDVKQ